jgi:hypothetical protein
MTGDTWDPAKLEGLRELVDIYHYLQGQGVVGRWVHVYRPTIVGDDATLYLERLSHDGLRGLIIPKHPAPGPVTIKPKGLVPGQRYVVSFQESARSDELTGAELMSSGLTLDKMPPGELVYLNLPLHPGSKLDRTPPTPPSSASKRAQDNMDFPGVELAWGPGTDDNWVSCYEIYRNGVLLDKVAKGTFYFDHSAGADLAANYDIRTVDGAGNVSPKVAAQGASAAPATVFDDTLGGALRYEGEWTHQTNAGPANAETLSSSKQKGANVELEFDGREVILFTKLGPDCGEAGIRLDGGEPELVDTYSADQIWGVGIWRKKVQAGKHRLRVEVLGQRNPRSKDELVYIDALRVHSGDQ